MSELPNPVREGEPVSASKHFNALLAYCRSLRPCSSPTVKARRTPTGTYYEASAPRPGTASASSPWFSVTASGANAVMTKGAILIPGRGFIWTDGGSVDVPGGSAAAPMWVCMVIVKATLAITLEVSVTEPNPQRGDAWEIPVARAYRSGSAAVILDSGVPIVVAA